MWPFSLLRRHPRTDLARMQYSGVGGSYGYGDSWRGQGMWGGTLPGTDTNWAAEVKDPSVNATVHACLRWVIDNVSEPECKVFRKGTKRDVPLPSHALLDLLETPNPEYDGVSLLQAAAVDYRLAGDSYVLKERNNRGEVVGLWWKPYWSVSPRWPNDGSAFIVDYLYRPGGRGVGIPYAKEDVIHFRSGLDSASEGRVGRHNTLPILREIALLNEASTYGASLLKNMAIPPYLMQPKDAQDEVNEEGRGLLRDLWASFTRDNRGKPLVPSVQMEIEKLGLSPEEMALDKVLLRPSMSICAAFGIHPAVIFLSNDAKGLDNGGQQEMARKQSYHDCLVPMLKRFARTFTHSLLPDFEGGPIRTPRLYVGYDFSGVQALSEDQNALFERLNGAVGAGWMRVSEAREFAGMDSGADEAVFYRPSTVQAVEAPGEEVEVEPATPADGGTDGEPADAEADDATD